MFTSDSSTINVTTGTSMQVLHHATLPVGKWLVHVMVRWDSNATGRRGLTVYNDAGHTQSVGVASNDFRPAVNGSVTCTKSTFFTYKENEPTELYVCGYQNSGTTIGCTVRLLAIRIV